MRKLLVKGIISSLLVSSFALCYALTPLELQTVIAEAQQSVNDLPEPNEEELLIAIAVSLSMPRASLERLAIDARDAGLALSFRGVGVEINDKPDEKPRTVLERYGKGLIARHMEDFKFLTDLGASVKIDSVLFSRQTIKDVPQVMVMPVCKTACENTQALFVARGDVTLRYALDYLASEITTALKKHPGDSQLTKAAHLVKSALDKLGDRP